MKDYSMTKKAKENFILSYEKTDEELIIYYPDDEYTIPYTEENEKKILVMMKDQIYTSSIFEEVQRRKMEEAHMKRSIELGLIFATVVLGVTSVLPFYAIAPFTLFLLGNAIVHTKQVKECEEFIDDIEKQYLYLDNEKEINEFEEKRKEYAIDQKLKEFEDLDQVRIEYVKVGLNNLDRLTLEEFKIYLRDMKRDQNLEVDYSKKLVKKKK